MKKLTTLQIVYTLLEIAMNVEDHNQFRGAISTIIDFIKKEIKK